MGLKNALIAMAVAALIASLAYLILGAFATPGWEIRGLVFLTAIFSLLLIVAYVQLEGRRDKSCNETLLGSKVPDPTTTNTQLKPLDP